MQVLLAAHHAFCVMSRQQHLHAMQGMVYVPWPNSCPTTPKPYQPALVLSAVQLADRFLAGHCSVWVPSLLAVLCCLQELARYEIDCRNIVINQLIFPEAGEQCLVAHARCIALVWLLLPPCRGVLQPVAPRLHLCSTPDVPSAPPSVAFVDCVFVAP